MMPATAIFKRLAVSKFSHGQATVTLDGQPIGEISVSSNFFYATVLGTSWGGGRTVKNALKSCAVGYCALKEKTQ